MATDALAVAAAPGRGVMTVSVSGLPADAPAPLTVTGPNEYHRVFSSSIRLDSLVVGDYVLHAGGTTTPGGSYGPTVDSQAVHISSGSARNVQVQYVKVARPASTGLPAHPRVWMTPARITQLRTQVAANTIRWQKVKAAADAQLVVNAPTTASTLPMLCLAYLGTGNAAYAQRAGVVLVANTDSAAQIALRGDDAYPYRTALPTISEGLDWCYNGLTVAQRQRAATWLMDAADWVWPESNPAPHRTYGVTDVLDNYYWGFMMTGPAALAAAGDDTGHGTVSGSDRAAYHQQLFLTKWANVVVPALAGPLAGGEDAEGTGYDISIRIAEVVDAFQTAGLGLTTPWLAQTLQWHLNYTMPGGRYFAPLGDQARASNAPLYIYNREAMLMTMAAANAGSTLDAQAQYWLALIGQAPYALDDGNLASELLYYDPLAPSAPDLSGLPKGYLSPGAGDFIYRQSWTDPNATVMVFESGPLSESHMSLDANGLMIWKGSFWISASANIYSHSGIVQTTQNYNNLTVGGIGQMHHNGARILATSVSDNLVVVQAQADTAYFWPPDYRAMWSVAPYYLRTVAYLPVQDAFVIVDRVTARDSTQAKVWRWHSLNPATILGNTFTLANPAGDQRCVGNVLLPTDAVLGAETIALGSGGAVSSHAVTVTLPVGRTSDVVVTVFQCSDVLPAPWTPTAEITANQAIVTIGIHRVTVPLDDAQAVGFETAAIISDH